MKKQYGSEWFMPMGVRVVCGLAVTLCLWSGAFGTACAQTSEVTVSAAASLTNAFTELKAMFEKVHPDIVVRLNFAASNPLLKQMQEGAPVDVFVSADEETMDKAVASHCVNPDTRKIFAANSLVLVVPLPVNHKPAPSNDAPELPATTVSPAAASGTMQAFLTADTVTRLALGNPESVPAGRYASEALQAAGLWEPLQPKMILGASVRQVLDYVARGEVDAGFVYGTDALVAKNRVRVLLRPTGHSPVRYPLAIASQGPNPEAAKAFVDFVLGEQGGGVLVRYGFEKP